MSEIYLKFNRKEKYNIKIESISEMNESIFYKLYVKSYKELNSMLNENKEENMYSNNIIAFLGERGSGKTSCMRSLLNSLEKLSSVSEIDEETSLTKEMLSLTEKRKKFEFLNIIEPSFFSEKINILELIISNMFKNFRKKLESSYEENYENKKKLLRKFQEVFKNLKYISCAEQYESSEIEELMFLSYSVDLKENLNNLIEEYLLFFKKDRLIISIDDIDLNARFAYKMVEDIRKYLSLHNVIIVLALKLEQLKMIIKKEYLLENEIFSLDKQNKIVDIYTDELIKDTENRVDKYLLKLIPYERRILLKDINKYSENIKIFIENEEISPDSEKFQEKILNFIYNKTNMLFLKPDYGINKIIPTNLREFVNFISIIGKLKNKSENKQENYEIFEEYIFSSLFKEKLLQYQQNIIEKLRTLNYKNKNSYIVSKLDFLINSNSNSSSNSKAIDIMDVIKKIRKYEEKDTSYLSFFLRITYSDLLYEAYYDYKKNRNNNFLEILGKKNYLKEYKKLISFSINEDKLEELIEERKELSILQFFILEEENFQSIHNKKVSFSLIGPFYNFILKKDCEIKKLDSKNLVFRNIEIYEKFCLFLDNVRIEKLNSFEELWKRVIDFYEKDLFVFAEQLPSCLKDKFLESIGIFCDLLKELKLEKNEFFKNEFKSQNKNENENIVY